MGRRSDSKTRILSAAQELIELRGYSQIGVAEICTAAGVPKGSFYYFFDSKDALALAVIEMRWQAQLATWTEILSSDDPPLDRLRRLCADTVAGLRAAQHSCGSIAGCLFGNLALELSNSPAEAIRGRLREIFDAQVDMIAQVVPAPVARPVMAQIEGQIMFAQLYNDIACLDTLWPSVLALAGEVPAGRR